MLNKMERMMMKQMLADLETLKERNSDLVDYKTESSTTKIRTYAFSERSIDGRIRLLKQLLQVLA